MKNVLKIALLSLVGMVLYSCSHHRDNTESSDQGKLISYPPKEMLDIPVSITKEKNTFKVSFFLSHKFYFIENNDENKSSIELLKNAVDNGTLLNLAISSNHQNTDNIISISLPTIEEKNKFKIAFQASKNNSAHLKKVIPDIITLNKLFSEIKDQTCSLLGRQYPCISFDYPEDGCYARAHKVRQYLANKGYDCEKQFIYGDLNYRYGSIDPTKGGCCVSWSYHVAILVSYKDEKGVIQKRIIDPSVSGSGPITEEKWRDLCVNSSCGKSSLNSFVTTSSDVYARSPKGKVLYDPNYKNTDCVLEIFSHVFGCSLPVPSTSSCEF